jgi:hypothetical protein
VASSGTGVAEAAGEACVLVEPSEIDAIASGLRAAIEDTRLRAELRGRVPGHLARFTWARAAEAMAQVYRGVVRS